MVETVLMVESVSGEFAGARCPVISTVITPGTMGLAPIAKFPQQTVRLRQDEEAGEALEADIGAIVKEATEVLYDGSGSLANSVVRKGRMTRGTKQTEVAVKAVSLQSDEESIAMIRRECKILGELGNAHPHILPMLSCAELSSEYVLVTPFASHGDLSQEVRLGCECLEEIDTHRLTRQLMAGLAHLHAWGIVHGDVKPKNVFLTKHQDAFLAQLSDFGLAQKLPEGAASIRLPCRQGSHGYVPPEMLQDKELFPASDLFALGIMTFQLLACYDPFYPPSQVTDELEFDETCWSPISAEAQQFVVQLLDIDPRIRGTAEACTHKWLATPEGELARGAPRGICSPTPVPHVHFHSIEACQALWEAERPEPLSRRVGDGSAPLYRDANIIMGA
jgi:serine/threonine protein kinase